MKPFFKFSVLHENICINGNFVVESVQRLIQSLREPL